MPINTFEKISFEKNKDNIIYRGIRVFDKSFPDYKWLSSIYTKDT